MADQIVNTIKPILLDELTKKIKENKDKFDVVEAGIDDIIKKVKEVVEPISSPIVAGMKLIPFGNPSERLQELADDLKLKMDGIDLSELEKIPDLSPEITIRVKALPQKVKDKLKVLIDELVSGTPTAEPTTTATAEPTTTATAEPTTTATAEPTTTATDADAEKSIEDGLNNLTNDDKKETIDRIMKMLEDTGILDEIKKRLCTPAAILPNETEQKVVDNKVESGQEAATEKARVEKEAAEKAKAEEATKKAKAEQEEAEEATKKVKADQEALEKEIKDAEDELAKQNPTIPPPVGGSNKKHRRKTKKNIHRQKRTYTKFGRNF